MVIMMDEADQKLISELSRDARASVTTLARALGLARTTVQARIERLERAGVIAGYTIKLGEEARQERIKATVLLQLDPRSGPRVIQRLKTLPQVEIAHTSSGRFDMILQLATRNTARMDELLDKIGAITGVRSSESLIHLATKIDRAL